MKMGLQTPHFEIQLLLENLLLLLGILLLLLQHQKFLLGLLEILHHRSHLFQKELDSLTSHQVHLPGPGPLPLL